MKSYKKHKKLAIVLALSVIIVGLVLVVLFLERGTSGSSSETAVGTDLISLSPFNKADIEKIEYSAGDSSVILEKEDGIWMLKGGFQREADGTLANEMASALSSVYAVKKIDFVQLSEYGLDDPRLSVTVYLANDETHNYRFGITNSYNGYSYILYDGSVYMFEDTLSSSFEKSTKELLGIKDKIPSFITKNTVMSFTVTDNEGTSHTYTNCDNMAELLSSLRTNFAFDSLVSYDINEEELAEYGLVEKQGIISIFYNSPSDTQENLLVDTTFTLIVGSEIGGKVYYMLEDSENVFVSDEEAVKNIIEVLMAHSEEHENDCLSKE